MAKIRSIFIINFVLLIFIIQSSLIAQNENSYRIPGDSHSNVVVYGSSVATGWVTSRLEKYDHQNGWAARLGRYLNQYGFEFNNVSVPGFSTTTFLQNWDEKIPKEKPDYLIIGLSLGNEGIRGSNPDSVYSHFFEGIKAIIEKCKESRIVPLLGSCYSNNGYDSLQYSYTRRMNVLLNSLQIPMFNFLGAVDDGSGHFPEGSYFDPAHPNDLGHEEMFYTIVPSLFRSVESGKPLPKRNDDAEFFEIAPNIEGGGIFYIPDEVIHSFSVSFAFKANGSGTLYTCTSGKKISSLKICRNGMLTYISSEGDSLTIDGYVNDGNQHRISIIYRYLKGETLIYLDGTFLKRVKERIEPMCIAIAETGVSADEPLTGNAAISELLIYRSALSEDEVLSIERGEMIHASLEVYSALERIAQSNRFLNLAQSEAELLSSREGTEKYLTEIERKIFIADSVRINSLSFPEPSTYELSDFQLTEYSGSYNNDAGDAIKISVETGSLYISVNGNKSKLTAISDTEFYIVTPFLNSTCFSMNAATGISEVVFKFQDKLIRAQKVTQSK